jgi:hypothetical protein
MEFILFLLPIVWGVLVLSTFMRIATALEQIARTAGQGTNQREEPPRTEPTR